jgi:hypothetical protein
VSVPSAVYVSSVFVTPCPFNVSEGVVFYVSVNVPEVFHRSPRVAFPPLDDLEGNVTGGHADQRLLVDEPEFAAILSVSSVPRIDSLVDDEEVVRRETSQQ